MVVPSTYHLLIKYPIENGVMEIKGEQENAHSCYNATMKQVILK